GSVNVLVCAFNFASRTAHPSDMIWLAGGGYLLGESILRLRKWLKNELSGSVLGFVVSPLAAKLLDPALLPSQAPGSTPPRP
ncbi:MAG TPA: hypothetical protein VLR94_02640, partial [Acidobacteriota bacterium]|nr:hypothetical protein [Acidobacteriota bacterium]